MGKIFPRKYQFIEKFAIFSVPEVFHTSGFNGKFLKIMSQGKRKNLQFYRYSSRRCPFYPIKNAPFDERRKYRDVFAMEKKLWSTNIWKPPTGRGGRCDALFVKSILDHMFAKVHWRNDQSYFHDNRNYFSHFQKIKEKKL